MQIFVNILCSRVKLIRGYRNKILIIMISCLSITTRKDYLKENQFFKNKNLNFYK
jgi:hypothetical protein